jgi:hypothetical protein
MKQGLGTRGRGAVKTDPDAMDESLAPALIPGPRSLIPVFQSIP